MSHQGQAFNFLYACAVRVIYAPTIALAKRKATAEFRPLKPGRWVKQGKTLFVASHSAQVFRWVRTEQCKHTRRTGILNMERCTREAARNGLCTRHANERGA